VYEPDHTSKFYLFLIAAFASLIGWAFFTFYRPVIIEAGCSDIAANSANYFSKNKKDIDAQYEYENIKARCLGDIKYD